MMALGTMIVGFAVVMFWLMVNCVGPLMAVMYVPAGIPVPVTGWPYAAASVVFRDREGKVVETKKGWSAVAVSKDGKRVALGGDRVELVDPSTLASGPLTSAMTATAR